MYDSSPKQALSPPIFQHTGGSIKKKKTGWLNRGLQPSVNQCSKAEMFNFLWQLLMIIMTIMMIIIIIKESRKIKAQL